MNTLIEEAKKTITAQIKAIQAQIEVLRDIDEDLTEAQEADLEGLEREESDLTDVLDNITTLDLYGFEHHRGSAAPGWYHDARIPGERISVQAGSSPFNEWYVVSDPKAMEKSLMEIEKVMQWTSRVDGKIYRDSDVYIGGDEDVTCHVVEGSQPLTLSDLADLASVF